jgi:hypothetical protein
MQLQCLTLGMIATGWSVASSHTGFKGAGVWRMRADALRILYKGHETQSYTIGRALDLGLHTQRNRHLYQSV